VTAVAHAADLWHAGTGRPGRDDAVLGTVAEDRSAAVRSGTRTVRSWPLLVLAAPAAAEVWSGWVGMAQKTGFGLVSPLSGIWPSLDLDTTITLPVGVEAYAAYALRAWLARDSWITSRTRRFARWSAMCSFALGMAGQIACHLLAQAGAARAPWPVTTVVSCLPVLVLAMGNRAGPHAARRRRRRHGNASRREGRTSHAAAPCLLRRGPGRTGPGPVRRQGTAPLSGPQPRTRPVRSRTAPPSGPACRFTPRPAGPAWPPAGLPLRAVRYPGAPCATRA
jgi:hypothetical protein